MFATGAGGLEVAVAMAGYGYDLPCPRVIGVELTGRLGLQSRPRTSSWSCCAVTALAAAGVVFEFFGDGVAGISTTGRATICNMIMETGATTGCSLRRRDPPLARRPGPRGGLPPAGRRPGASYDEVEGRPVPARAAGGRAAVPGDVVPVTELAGTELVQVCVGSSVNSSCEDLATVAAALRGRQVHPDIQPVTPGSRQILDVIGRSGVSQDLLAAGARMLEPICGPCIGIGQAPVSGRRRCAPSTATSWAQRHRRGRRVPVLTIDRGRERPDRQDHRPEQPRTGRPCDRLWPQTRPCTSARSPACSPRPSGSASRSSAAPTWSRRGDPPRPLTTSTAVLIGGRRHLHWDMAPDGVIAGVGVVQHGRVRPVHVPPP